MAMIPKIKAPEARDLQENMWNSYNSLKYHLLHQDNFLAHLYLLCHVTYVTAFTKRSYPDVKHENLWFIIILARQFQKYKVSTSVKYFHIFLFNNRYQNWLLKTVGKVVKQLI